MRQTLRFGLSYTARITNRPMRPKPLIPTLTILTLLTHCQSLQRIIITGTIPFYNNSVAMLPDDDIGIHRLGRVFLSAAWCFGLNFINQFLSAELGCKPCCSPVSQFKSLTCSSTFVKLLTDACCKLKLCVQPFCCHAWRIPPDYYPAIEHWSQEQCEGCCKAQSRYDHPANGDTRLSTRT